MLQRRCLKIVAALLAASALLATQAQAGISYTTMGSLYSENFNGLPTDMPNNSSIETVYTDGWQDDVDFATTSQDDVSVLGWHLFHPLSPGGTPPENGFNGYQRFRSGPGQNTGAFWSYGANANDPEKALGSLGATTIAANGANMYMGLQLINNTAFTLNRFTLTFDGEQWRDGQDVAGETLAFDFSLIATEADWNTLTTPLFTAVPTLNFTSPVVSGTNSSGTVVDGNTVGRVADITATVTNFSWAPGAELWLRWGDPQLASLADDGLAIDNVRFTADDLGTGSNNDIVSVQTGNSSTPSTWSNNAAPSPGNTYRVLSTHTVTVDTQFDGDLLRAQGGGVVNIGPGANATPIAFLDIDLGGNLTETVSGDFQLGVGSADPTVPLGVLTTNQGLTFTADPGSDVRIDLDVSGTADLTVNSNGDGSDLILFDVADLDGVIRFSGTGDKVRLVREQDLDTIEMNSTGGAGANVLSYETRDNTGGGVVIFNQPGTLDHATTSANGTRLVQPSVLEVNAPVTVNLSRPIVPDGVNVFNERRLQAQSSIRGASDITVNGSASPNTGAELAAGITLNEFELGSSGDATSIPNNTFSGVLTANNYVNVELRNSLSAAKIVVNDNARFEMGRQVVGTAKVTNFGEIDVNAGGTLEIGFEQVQDSNSTNSADTGQQVGHLGLVTTDGRPGSLTLQHGGLSNPSNVNSEPLGSLLIMQVNGKNANEYDTIAAQGAVTLDGVLKIVVNPKSSLSSATAGTQNPVYTPALGDVIPLITATAGTPTPGNFNGDSVVNAADLAVWKTAFGVSAAGDADADGDSDGNDFLVWQRNLGQTASGGITGSFDDIVFEDVALLPSDPPVATDAPDTATPVLVDSEGVMASLDLKFQLQITSSAVNLLVVDATPIAAVPEPAAALLAAFGLIGIASASRSKR